MFKLGSLACCLLPLNFSLAFDAREATIDSVHTALFGGVVSCREITEGFISRIVAFNPKLNAILALNPSSLKYAEELDRLLANGTANRGQYPLFCIPVLLKDNYDTYDMPTTGACLDLAESQPNQDAPAVAAMRKAGALIFGKSTLHELALEGLSVSSLGGQALNPYDLTRTPGGSSGGSGAAVAASFSVFATGTDTVNSVRSPPASNSLVSVRPTRGLISRAGIIPISYTQDAIGPIGRTIRDVSIALTVMASVGFDPQDNVTALAPSTPIDYTRFLQSAPSLKGLKIGVLMTFFNNTPSSETTPVNNVFSSVLSKMKNAGVTIIPLNDPAFISSAISSDFDVQQFEYREMFDAYIQRPQAGGKHPNTLQELYNTHKYLVIPSQYSYVNNSLAWSTGLPAYFEKLRGISNLTLHLAATFARNGLDAIVYPEQQNLVVKVGSPSQSGRNGILAAVTGSPVVVVPAGFSPTSSDAPRGVPIGMEILGRPFSDGSLLRIGQALESLLQVRKMPALTDVSVFQNFNDVPAIVPNRKNIPTAYPIGVRG